MKIIDNKLFIIDNFIFPETCNFLIKNFSSNIKETGKPGVYVGPYSNKDNPASLLSGNNKVYQKSDTPELNIAIDLFTSICNNIEKTVSLLFNKNITMRSYFYSHMKPGGYNALHADNYNEEYSNDFSAILYLSDSYKGGNILFPNLKEELKPSPGTLITFVGDKEMSHEVKEVTDGDRINIVCFLSQKE